MKVPVYQPNVSLRPAFQQGITVQASADDMGAAVGRGMQQVGSGLSQAATAFEKMQDVENVANTKDRINQLDRWKMQRQYGEGGFMTLQGKAALDGRAQYEADLEAKRKELGAGLTPAAARMYDTASTAAVTGAMQQGVIHTANERKTFFKQTSSSRIENLKNEALMNYGTPAVVDKNIAVGWNEIDDQAQMLGWDAETIKNQKAEFASGVRKEVALRLLEDDPLAADKYVKQHKANLTGADQYELGKRLEKEVMNERSKRNAEDIMKPTRNFETAGDAEGGTRTLPAAGGAVAPSQTGRRLADQGPTQARSFLISKAPRGAYSVDNLDEGFAMNMAAMLQDAPSDIRDGLGILSGHRSHEHQKQLFRNSNGSGRRVARPGNSNHEVRSDGTAKAIDLSYNGRSLEHAPQRVIDWVHANAGKYGMYFPMSWENWHIEPIGTRGRAVRSGTVAPRTNQIASRSVMPSYDDIERRLQAIPDEEERDLTRKRIYATMEARSKAEEATEKHAKAELWRYVDQGMTPDDVPSDVRQAAGMGAVSAAWGYIGTVAKGREIQDDEGLVYSMRRHAAENPEAFSQLDILDYADRLSKETRKEFMEKQTSWLTDQRKAKDQGTTESAAYKLAEGQLEGLGYSTTGKSGDERKKAAADLAAFQNMLASQIAEFRANEKNGGREPNQMEIQAMISRLLLPKVVRQEASWFNPFGFDTVDKSGHLFQGGSAPDGATVEANVQYKDIPLDMRRGIKAELEKERGRTVSEEEIVEEYEQFIINGSGVLRD